MSCEFNGIACNGYDSDRHTFHTDRCNRDYWLDSLLYWLGKIPVAAGSRLLPRAIDGAYRCAAAALRNSRGLATAPPLYLYRNDSVSLPLEDATDDLPCGPRGDAAAALRCGTCAHRQDQHADAHMVYRRCYARVENFGINIPCHCRDFNAAPEV